MKPLGWHEETHYNKQWLLDTFEQAAVGIAQISPEGKWLRLNRKYCEILGYSQDELMNKTVQEITHPDDIELNMRIYQKLFKGEIDNFTWEKRYIRKDGSHVWTRILASIVRDMNGTSLYSIAVVEDISERKKAEEELKRSEEREHLASEIIDNIRSEIELDIILRHIVEGIGQFTQADRCLIWLYDAKTQHLQVPNVEREYCRSSEISQLISIINDFPGIEKTIISDKLIFPFALGCTKVVNIPNIFTVSGLTADDFRGIEARDIKSFLHVPILYKDQYLGCIRVHSTVQYRQWDEETVSLVQHMAAKVAVAIHHAKILRELQASEASLKSYANELQESNKNLEYFATIASHDLQAPLRKIRVLCEKIHQEAKDTLSLESLDEIEQIESSVIQAQSLVTELLEFSRVVKTAKPFCEVNLSYVMERVLENLGELIKEKQAQIEVGELTTILGDELQLEQLLQNLVENGLKYQPIGKRPLVRVQMACFAHIFCDIVVEDNGIGFDSIYSERIFKPFERLHGKNSLYPGTGVGLAICKRVVDRHRGKILVESEPDKGSRFTVRLPVTPEGPLVNF